MSQLLQLRKSSCTVCCWHLFRTQWQEEKSIEKKKKNWKIHKVCLVGQALRRRGASWEATSFQRQLSLPSCGIMVSADLVLFDPHPFLFPFPLPSPTSLLALTQPYVVDWAQSTSLTNPWFVVVFACTCCKEFLPFLVFWLVPFQSVIAVTSETVMASIQTHFPL